MNTLSAIIVPLVLGTVPLALGLIPMLFWQKLKAIPVLQVKNAETKVQLIIEDRLLDAALTEQVRREDAHQIDYDNDMRIRAIQQRLSRMMGADAFGPRMHKRILTFVLAHPVLGDWHK